MKSGSFVAPVSNGEFDEVVYRFFCADLMSRTLVVFCTFGFQSLSEDSRHLESFLLQKLKGVFL